MLETLNHTIRIGSTPTFLYFDLYLYSAYAAYYVYSKWYTYYPYLFVVIQLAPGSRQSTHPLGSPIKLKREPASSEPNAKRHAGRGFIFTVKKFYFIRTSVIFKFYIILILCRHCPRSAVLYIWFRADLYPYTVLRASKLIHPSI